MKNFKDIIAAVASGVTIEEGQYQTATLEPKQLRAAAEELRKAGYDFLNNLTGIDNGESLGVVYHIAKSDNLTDMVVLKTNTADRENPLLYTVCDLWKSADLYEREVYDFYGIRFINHPDMRRIFLRADWQGFPFRKDYDPASNSMPTTNVDIDSLESMPTITINEDGKIVEKENKLFGPNEYIVNFGPQHPATHGVLHLRVSLDGETVKKVDPNFGYIHRGIEKMSESMTYPQILPYTERLDYLSGAMNRHALCMCVEKALGIEVPKRAQYVRVIFDELTRIASHLLGWGSMTMDMGAITAFIYGMRDREEIMKIFEETAGGRLMTSYSVIGGLAEDVHPDFKQHVQEFIPYMRKMMKEHHQIFTGNPIATGRMHNVGWLTKETAVALGTTGPTGRASGWHCDIRKIEPYSAYMEPGVQATFKEMLRNTDTNKGDTFDRYLIRLDEIEESLNIIEYLINNLPDGDFKAKVPAMIKLPEGEYYQRIENARGEFAVYIKSDGGKNPARIKFRSPCMTLISALDPLCQNEKIADLIMIGGSLDYVIPCADR